MFKLTGGREELASLSRLFVFLARLAACKWMIGGCVARLPGTMAKNLHGITEEWMSDEFNPESPLLSIRNHRESE